MAANAEVQNGMINEKIKGSNTQIVLNHNLRFPLLYISVIRLCTLAILV